MVAGFFDNAMLQTLNYLWDISDIGELVANMPTRAYCKTGVT